MTVLRMTLMKSVTEKRTKVITMSLLFQPNCFVGSSNSLINYSLPLMNLFISPKIKKGNWTREIISGIKARQLINHKVLFHLLSVK